MTQCRSEPTNRLLWASDIHLDKAEGSAIATFKRELATAAGDGLIITGDISRSDRVVTDLMGIAEIVAPQPVFFVAGNHDYHGSTFAAVRHAIDAACRKHRNLHHLTGSGLFRINRETVILGHEGWADGLAGSGRFSRVVSRDRFAVGDFQGLSRNGYFQRIRELGDKSARHFRGVLPFALQTSNRVIIVTHVPPFMQAACYNETQCGSDFLPHFSNIAAGMVIGGIARRFPQKTIEVYAGHTHCGIGLDIARNLTIKVASVVNGKPELQQPIILS